MKVRYDYLGFKNTYGSSKYLYPPFSEQREIGRTEEAVPVMTGHILKAPQEGVDVSPPTVKFSYKCGEIIKQLEA